MIWFLTAIIILLLALLIVSVWFNIKFGGMLLRFEDNIQEALDEMDESYKKISKILELPLTFDDPYIRQVVEEIGRVRDAILRVATKVSVLDDTKQNNNNDDTNRNDS